MEAKTVGHCFRIYIYFFNRHVVVFLSFLVSWQQTQITLTFEQNISNRATAQVLAVTQRIIIIGHL